ncbi:hypothetical protein Pcinc_003149 [Petrolisthes cinctipes]|uniref:Uncharacterized protein n=1 Tax=Petrolisthes cinctipes TaxID=88211 RepID=A0AAE1GJC8_PETCI|nr:hypothetical protein Pcinc_003149 [Petrolisthes cinctipes]
MRVSQREIDNGVNGSPSDEDAVAPGRCIMPGRCCPTVIMRLLAAHLGARSRRQWVETALLQEWICARRIGTWNVNTLYYSGGEEHGAGVGVLLRRELADAVVGCWQVSQRVILVKIAAKPVGLNLIQ